MGCMELGQASDQLTKYIHLDLDLHWNVLRARGCYHSTLDAQPALLQNSLLPLGSQILKLRFQPQGLQLPTFSFNKNEAHILTGVFAEVCKNSDQNIFYNLSIALHHSLL